MQSQTNGAKLKKSAVLWAIGAGLVVIGSAQFGAVLAQDSQGKSSGAAGGDADMMAEMMQDPALQKWMELAAPGADHEIMKKMVGTWDAKVKMWMDPSAPPMESTGVYNARIILGGRYLAGHFKGEAMGQPFEGISVFGYDNYKQKFVDNWIDTLGTGFTTSEGTINEAKDTITMLGKMPNVVDGSIVYSKNVTILVDADTMRIEMFQATAADGEYLKSMEIVYRRVK